MNETTGTNDETLIELVNSVRTADIEQGPRTDVGH
jgi:hypothetical protein